MSNFYWRWATSTWFGSLYQQEFCPAWDAALNRLIDKHWRDAVVDSHCAEFGGVRVWISNSFYSYGHQWGGLAEHRPSLRTMRRLDSLVRHIQDKQQAEKRAEHLKQMGRY